MTTQPKTSRIPAPLYAAAGAGELAYEQLRKLPAVVSDLRNKVAAENGVELRQKASETLRTATLTAGTLRQRAATDLDLQKLREAADLKRVREAADLNRLREIADLDKLREAADLDKLREAAVRNAAVVVAGAHAAQERALAAYGRLVARGERVVGAGVLEAAETLNTDIETTEAGSAVEAAPAAVKAETTEVPTPAEVAEIAEAKPAAVKKRATRVTKATAKPATPSAKLPRATKRTRPAAE
ncbi:hypothetical protein [Micromonospora sp. NPDC126480]|uniref:hypothetical protein n=1 Tax=Micromonospora sp. NPDC126480 TaxID=3155312 RepID=UPI0033220252